MSSKTSCYSLFVHNQLTVYGIRLAACMLPLQPKFEFLNIRYAAYEIRIAVYSPKAYCPTTRLPFVMIRLAAFNSDRFCPTSSLPIFNILLAACYSELLSKITVNYFLILQFGPKTFYNYTRTQNVIHFANRSNFRISK